MIDITPQYLASQGLSSTFPDRFWSKVNKNGPIPQHRPELGPCWVWIARKHKFGYGEINKGRHSSAPIRSHVASWVLHYGPVPEGKRVLHHCDNGSCVRPDHLWVGTQIENVMDCMAKGRHPTMAKKGELNHRHKLTEVQVIEILNAERSTERVGELCNKFHVCRSTIGAIFNRKTWRHLLG